MLWIGVLSLAAVGYLVARKRHVEKTRERIQRILSEELPSDPVNRFQENMDVEGAATVLLTFGDLLYNAAKIDPTVLDAIELRAAGHPRLFSEVVEYIAGRIDSGVSIEGMANNWQGVAGELIAMETLKEQGHSVIPAASPSQQGWDILVDGEPYQVKTAGMSAVSEHLERYPDIPVIAPAEVASPGDHVLPMEGLDPSHMHESATQTLESIHHFSSLIHKLPLVTLAVSSYRNWLKVRKELITPGEAMLFVAQDTACVGGGAAVGAKLGLAIFGWTLPTAVAGAALGAFCGVMAGRRLARFMRGGKKYRELKKEWESSCIKLRDDLVERRDKILSSLLAGVRNLQRHVAASRPGKGFFSGLRELLWPSEKGLLFPEISKRTEEEIRRVKEALDSFIAEIRGLEGYRVMQKAASRPDCLAAAGLVEDFERTAEIGTRLKREAERIR